MKQIFIVAIITALMTDQAFAQWTIDSLSTAGVYSFNGTTQNKAVFSNGGAWNIFDALSNVHTSGTFSISRGQVEAVTHGNKVYLGGGKYGNFADPLYTKNVDVYDAVTDSWTIWSLSKNREVGGAAAAGDKIIFAGGTGRSDISGPVYMYATADIFDVNSGIRTTGKLSKARTNIAAGAAGNKIVFAGGWYWDITYNTLASNSVDIYDVTTGLWSKTTLSAKRDNIAVAVAGDKIIFAGGQGTYGNSNAVDIYDAINDSWTTSTLPLPRYSMKSVVIGNNVYFAGGAYDPVENEIDLYNTITGNWTQFYMPVSLSGFSMSLLNGKIYFAGGYNTSAATYSDLIQIYDPVAASWSVEHLSVARSYPGALTCGNKAYFAGGYSAYGYPVPLATNRVDILTTLSPVVDFTADATIIYQGTSVNFTDLSTNAPTLWQWTFDGGTPATSADQNPVVQYNTNGIFSVTLTATNATGSGTLTKNGFITVNNAPCLVPDGFAAVDITSSSAMLTWNAVTGALKYKVKYKVSGNNPWITTTVTSPYYTINGLMPNTKYLWKVKTICGGVPSVSSPFSASQKFSTVPLKMAPVESLPQLNIYPNPVSDVLSINLNHTAMLPAGGEIYDSYGRLLKTFRMVAENQTVEVGNLAPGNYLITIVDAGGFLMQSKFTKQ